jgi:hypothetical protein
MYEFIDKKRTELQDVPESYCAIVDTRTASVSGHATIEMATDIFHSIAAIKQSVQVDWLWSFTWSGGGAVLVVLAACGRR